MNCYPIQFEMLSSVGLAVVAGTWLLFIPEFGYSSNSPFGYPRVLQQKPNINMESRKNFSIFNRFNTIWFGVSDICFCFALPQKRYSKHTLTQTHTIPGDTVVAIFIII